MWEWLKDNYLPVAASIQMLSLLVWALYVEIFLIGHRHRRRPNILINRGGGHTLDAACVVSNMSEEPLYIQAVLATLRTDLDQTDYDEVVCSLSDLDVHEDAGGDRRAQFLQGPLGSGEMLELGSFGGIAEMAVRNESGRSSRASIQALDEITLTVVASYTGDGRTVAAERSFNVEEFEGQKLLYAQSLPTRQISSRRRIRKLERTLEKDLRNAAARRAERRSSRLHAA